MMNLRTLVVACLGLFTFACSQAHQQTVEATSAPALAPAKPIGIPLEIKAPLGLPPVPIPADNPPTAETVALGRKLYYDTKLSADNSTSCATCHSPKMGFGDGLAVSTGIRGQTGGRNAPVVTNSAYNTIQFWDGRAPSLEEQAGGPMQNPVEMGHSIKGIEQELSKDPVYVDMFAKAWGPGPITFEKVRKSIASFERTVISGDSPFDKYMYGNNKNDKKALSPAAIRGLALYRDPKKGNCAVCHTIEEKYALFTDNKFHNLGIGQDKKGELKDKGRSEISKNETELGAFKTPTLRNIALSAPYMHDGSEKTLKEVIDFYVGGGNSNPHLDKEIKPLKLNAQERADLVAFLNSLTGEMPADVGPPTK
jgi:cytochrome c peroxidase